jgi:hypothetical protein
MKTIRMLAGGVALLAALTLAAGCSGKSNPSPKDGAKDGKKDGKDDEGRRATRRCGRRLGRRQVPHRVHGQPPQEGGPRLRPRQRRQEGGPDQGRGRTAVAECQRRQEQGHLPAGPQGGAAEGRPRGDRVVLRGHAREARRGAGVRGHRHRHGGRQELRRRLQRGARGGQEVADRDEGEPVPP